MIPTQVTEFLKKERVPYEVLSHDPAYTARRVAQSLHLRGRDFAKTVMLKVQPEGRPIMAVIPAPRHLDFRAVEKVVGAPVELAREDEFCPLFPACEIGAEPPLGALYGVPMYVDADLLEDDDIVFNAGSHTEAIRMKRQDFERLTQPSVGRFSRSN
jgi:Ala-tRNA(Pro) deacylase